MISSTKNPKKGSRAIYKPRRAVNELEMLVGTKADFQYYNLCYPRGRILIVVEPNGKTVGYKIADGQRNFKELPYVAPQCGTLLGYLFKFNDKRDFDSLPINDIPLNSNIE